MDIKDQIRSMSEAVERTAREVADSSKKAAAKARIRRLIHANEAQLQSVYTEIGTRYFTENRCTPEEQYSGLFEQASDLLAQIDTLQAELAGMNNEVVCPTCGAKMTEHQKFCSECGAKNENFGKTTADSAEQVTEAENAEETESLEEPAGVAESAEDEC